MPNGFCLVVVFPEAICWRGSFPVGFFSRMALCLDGIFPDVFFLSGFCRGAYFLDPRKTYKITGNQIKRLTKSRAFTKNFIVSQI